MSKEDDPVRSRLTHSGAMPPETRVELPQRRAPQQPETPADGPTTILREDAKDKKHKNDKKERKRRLRVGKMTGVILLAVLAGTGVAGYLDYKGNKDSLSAAVSTELDITAKQMVNGAECMPANIVLHPGTQIRENPAIVEAGKLPLLTRDNIGQEVPDGSEIVVHAPSVYVDEASKATWLGFMPEDDLETQALFKQDSATIQNVIDQRLWVNYSSLQGQKNASGDQYFEVLPLSGKDAAGPNEKCSVGQNGQVRVGEVAVATSLTYRDGAFKKAVEWQQPLTK